MAGSYHKISVLRSFRSGQLLFLGSKSTPEQLRFPTVAGFTVRGNSDAGTAFSHFGRMILGGVDRRIGLTEPLAKALEEKR